jgi:tartrate-resistant acid phosphatase type 5
MQMRRIGEKLNIYFVISTGDNFYENGLKGVSDRQFEESFSGIYTAQSLQKPWYQVKNPYLIFLSFVFAIIVFPRDHD